MDVGMGRSLCPSSRAEQGQAQGSGDGGREDLAGPLCAGLARRPFEIHLHSFQRKIKRALGLKSGHCAPRSFAEARASWAAHPASAFELTHEQHVNDGAVRSSPCSPTPHTCPAPPPQAQRVLCLPPPGEACGGESMEVANTSADPSWAGVEKARTRLEGLFHKGFVLGGEFFPM